MFERSFEAVGHGNPSSVVTCQMEAVVVLFDALHICELCCVAELVLWDGFVPVLVVHESGFTCDAEELFQLW